MTIAKRSLSWQKTKLKDVCRDITVGHVGPMASQYVESGIPFLRSQNVEPFRLSRGDIKYISDEFHAKLKKSALTPGDVVVVRTGYPGTACVIPNDLPVSNCADLVVIRPSKELDSRFLVSIFNSAWGRGAVEGNLVGVAQQHFNIGAARELVVDLPPINTQRKIASILSTYDDLIENNTRRIAILEAMAQAVYREWFVEFRFPGHEEVKLVDSPLGKIPEGWEVVPLDSLKADEAYAINGGPFGSKLGTKDYVDNGVPVIRGTNLSEAGRFWPDGFVFVSEEKADELRANLARPGDIVVTQRGTLGQLGMIPHDVGYDRFVISQSQMKVTLSDAKAKSEYVFYFLKSPDANTRIKNLAVSSGVPHINLGTLREFEIVLPPLLVQRRFADFVSMAERSIELNLTRIRNLRTTRDLLLPKLISGQLDVEELDIDVGESIASTEEAAA